MKSASFDKPILTVDMVVLGLVDGGLHVLLVRRPNDPYRDQLALPGGFVHVDKDANSVETAHRILTSKVGKDLRHIEQLATFSGAQRDPRGWSASIAYMALVRLEDVPTSSSAEWHPVDNLPPLAFDHDLIIAAGLDRVRAKSSYSSLPALLMSDQFTLPQLQRVYEQVLGVAINPAAFRRKVLDQGMVEAVEGEQQPGAGAGRPAQVYRLGSDSLTDFGRVVMTPDRRRTPAGP